MDWPTVLSWADGGIQRLGAGLAFALTFLQVRHFLRQGRAADPIIEVQRDKRFDKPELRVLEITVRNRSDEALLMERIRIDRPRGALISTMNVFKNGSWVGLETPTTDNTEVGIQLEPTGTPPHETPVFGYRHRDYRSFSVSISVPGAKPVSPVRVAMRLRIASRRSAAKAKWHKIAAMI